MSVTRLNEKTIKALETPRKGNRIVWDGEQTGLGLRITAAGARAFVFRFVVDGRERRMTVGAWPAWSTLAARERAKELRRTVDRGEDPLGARIARRSDPTFGEVAREYLDTEAATQRRVADVEAMLKRDVLPHWANLRACDIRRRDVIALIEAKAQTAPAAANKVFSVVRRVFNFAIRRDLIESSPCVQVRKPGVERSRDRVLNRHELRTFWEALDGAHFSEQTAAALRLVLATAQRPGEVCGMRWEDLDMKGGVWTIPGEKSKNTLSHRVPLNATARRILKAIPKTSESVFPKSRGDGPIDHNTLGQSIRKALAKPERRRKLKDEREPLTIAKFTPHDLRRSAASHMASAGVQRFIVGRVLNHAEAGATRVYDRYGYDAEKRAALDTWDRLLKAIIAGEAEPSNVVELVR